MNPVTIIAGNSPLILAQPHSGTWLPETAKANLNSRGRQLIDTDWHVPELYADLVENLTVVRANFSRYLIDANRDPAGASLYPGQTTTELVPTCCFEGQPIWTVVPTDNDIAERRTAYHQAYHTALSKEIQRAKSRHGVALLYDCHSIRSQLPYLFDGQLPDINIGTNNGTTCAPELADTVVTLCRDSKTFTHVVNGRFRGGWTTRHYGHPANGVHALQMELAQRCYLTREQPPFHYDKNKAASLRSLLRNILLSLIKNPQIVATGAA